MGRTLEGRRLNNIRGWRGKDITWNKAETDMIADGKAPDFEDLSSVMSMLPERTKPILVFVGFV